MSGINKSHIGLPVIVNLYADESDKIYGIIKDVTEDGIVVKYGKNRTKIFDHDAVLINTTSFEHEELLKKHGLWYQEVE